MTQGVMFSGLNMSLLASLCYGLQLPVGMFAAHYKLARISASKSDAVVPTRKRMDFPLQVGNKCLPQAKEDKYLKDLCMSEERVERETQRNKHSIYSNVNAV